MAMRGIDDSCPECPCDEWTGHCGHFDCGACSQLRAFKAKVKKEYADRRAQWEKDKNND